MFEALRSMFSQSWASFRQELGRREPEDQVAELLGAMRREMVDARARLPTLGEEVVRVREEAERERRSLADCERRRELARSIGDQETVGIAEEYAARHRARLVVLEEKLRVAEAERALRAAEVERMGEEYRRADANRFVLLSRVRAAAAAGPQGARAGVADAFAEFDRLSDEIEHGAARDEALREVDASASSAAAADDVEARLRELKRRAGPR